MLEEHQLTITVEGKAKDKAEAISRALSGIQREIFKELDHLVVKAEPIKIDVIDANYTEFTERFLFFFMPRKRQRCHVTLEILVHLKTLNPEAITWNRK